MNDEAMTSYLLHIDTLLDNALGPNGYYGAFGMNMHTDNPLDPPGIGDRRRRGTGAGRAGDHVRANAHLGRRPRQVDDSGP